MPVKHRAEISNLEEREKSFTYDPDSVIHNKRKN